MGDKCENEASEMTVDASMAAQVSTENNLCDDVSGSKLVNEAKMDEKDNEMEVDNTKGSSAESEAEKERHAPKRRLSVITISDTDSDGSSICHVDSYQASASEAKKIRGDYSSDSYSGSSDDDSDQENDNETSVISLGSSQLSKCITELKTRAPRLSSAKLNPCFVSEDMDTKFLGHWSKKESFKGTNLTLHSDPFRICILDNFLENVDIVNNIIDDMTTLDWTRSKMDLYEFHRSKDLANLSWQRAIKSFYELLNDVIMQWVARLTNLKLTHISASCALYGPGDHLLVHDDLMSDRKVAFIYYMAPWDIQQSSEPETDAVQNESKEINENSDTRPERGWTQSMGGALEFLATDEKGMPTVPVKSLVPCNNTFAFFKVGNNTFHQVTEVLSFDFPRLTINGWFHGPLEDGEEPDKHVEEPTPIPYKDLAEKPHTEMFQTSLNEWIASTYLSPRTKFKIQQQIEQSSEISLDEFFLKNQYDIVVNSLRDKNLVWQKQGPAHLRHHDVLPLSGASEDVTQLCQLFSSNHFLRLLGDFTELRLKSYHSLQVQRWTAASYMVLPPKSHYAVTELDVILYLGLPDRLICGGSTIYLAPEETDSEPLINVEMSNNALNLVYSDLGTSKFTKYVSKLSLEKDEYFYIISCSYRE